MQSRKEGQCMPVKNSTSWRERPEDPPLLPPLSTFSQPRDTLMSTISHLFVSPGRSCLLAPALHLNGRGVLNGKTKCLIVITASLSAVFVCTSGQCDVTASTVRCGCLIAGCVIKGRLCVRVQGGGRRGGQTTGAKKRKGKEKKRKTGCFGDL